MTLPRPVPAARLRALPPYLFVEIDRKRRAKMAAGADVINLGVGDPDRPTPPFIIDAMDRAVRDAAHHQYPPSNGTAEFRAAAARFMHRRFGVKADPDRHILACIGTKEGIGHLPIAVVDPGDVVFIPRPCYPVYVAGATFAHAEIHQIPTTAQSGWRPELDRIPPQVAARARLMWANFPNNPTGVSADLDFFSRWVAFCSRHGIIAASDLAYSEVYFEQAPPSMWQAAGASLDSTLGIEFHSLSKTFNMTGWRIGFAVGHPGVIAALSAVKGNMDSGQFGAIQAAGATALDHADHPDVAEMRRVYRDRRDSLIPGLLELGCEVEPPRAGFFVWARCPAGRAGVPVDSMEFAARCLEEADVVIVPGAGFAEEARHYFRVALTVESPRLREAVQRLRRIDWMR